MRTIKSFSPSGLENFRAFLARVYGDRAIDESACISECIDAAQGDLNSGSSMTWEIGSASTTSRTAEVFRASEDDFEIAGHCVDIEIADSMVPLHHVYPGQTAPQPAYLEFTPAPETTTQSMTASYSGEIGYAVPVAVAHGLVIRLSAPASTHHAALVALQDDREFAALIQRIVDGHSVDWDGSNYRGYLDDDAGEAAEQAEQMLADLDQAAIWDVDDWLDGGIDINQAAEHDSIQDYADALEMCAESNVYVDGDIAAAAAKLLYLRLPDNDDDWTDAHRHVAQMLASYSGEYSAG